MIIDQFLIGAGMPLSVSDAAKRYGRAIADPGEPILKLTLSPQSSVLSTQHQPLDEDAFAPAPNRPARSNVPDQ